MFEITDFQKIGVGLAGFGIAFLFLGVLLVFDKGLLAIGNILFLSGLAFVIGLERTFRFFFQWHKMRGSAAFFGGIFVVLFGWPIVGMLLETYGFIVLFSDGMPYEEDDLMPEPVLKLTCSSFGLNLLQKKAAAKKIFASCNENNDDTNTNFYAVTEENMSSPFEQQRIQFLKEEHELKMAILNIKKETAELDRKISDQKYKHFALSVSNAIHYSNSDCNNDDRGYESLLVPA